MKWELSKDFEQRSGKFDLCFKGITLASVLGLSIVGQRQGDLLRYYGNNPGLDSGLDRGVSSGGDEKCHILDIFLKKSQQH